MRARSRTSELYMCSVDGTTIVLDLDAQRYYARKQPRPPSNAQVSTLESDTGTAATAVPVDLTRLTALRTSSHCAQSLLPYVIPLLRATLATTLTMRLFGPSRAIRHFRELKQRRARSVRALRRRSLEDSAHALRRLRPWLYTASNHCLLDSLITANYLLHLRCDALLVVGVRTRPFGAHAWVQSESFVVDETTERIQLFTPLLAI